MKRATVSGGPYAAIATGIATTAFSDTTAANGTTYFYVVSAVNIGGESVISNETSATPLPPAPAVPAGLTATAGDGQVELTWNASATAASYSVKRGTVSGGPYAAIATGIATTAFSDTTAVNGATYFYVVSAVNLGGESANSAETSATPLPPPPAAPTGLTAVAGKNRVSLTWFASPGATSYTIVRATVSGGPYTTVKTGNTTTSYTNTGLVNGTLYYYVVFAVNASGAGPGSGEVSMTPGPPNAPTGLALSAVSSTQINLTWTDNANNETSFAIYRSTTGSSFSKIATVA